MALKTIALLVAGFIPALTATCSADASSTSILNKNSTRCCSDCSTPGTCFGAKCECLSNVASRLATRGDGLEGVYLRGLVKSGTSYMDRICRLLVMNLTLSPEFVVAEEPERTYAIRRSDGTRVFFYSSENNYRHPFKKWGLNSLPERHASLVVLRDPRDVAVSRHFFYLDKNNPVARTKDSTVIPGEVEECVKRGSFFAYHFQQLLCTNAENVHIVRYEDVLSKPSLHIALLAEMMGLSRFGTVTPGHLRFVEDSVSMRSMRASESKNDMNGVVRFDLPANSTARHIRQGKAGEFAKNMISEDIDLSREMMCGDAMQHGYRSRYTDEVAPCPFDVCDAATLSPKYAWIAEKLPAGTSCSIGQAITPAEDSALLTCPSLSETPP
jgi:hypothetical protein